VVHDVCSSLSLTSFLFLQSSKNSSTIWMWSLSWSTCLRLGNFQRWENEKHIIYWTEQGNKKVDVMMIPVDYSPEVHPSDIPSLSQEYIDKLLTIFHKETSHKTICPWIVDKDHKPRLHRSRNFASFSSTVFTRGIEVSDVFVYYESKKREQRRLYVYLWSES
jgi:hypothetical protein